MTTTLPGPSTKKAKAKRTAAEPVPKQGAKPAAKPAAKAVPKPAAKPATRTAPKPGVKPAARPAGAPAARPARTRQPAKAPRTPFVLLIVGLLGGALVSLLLLNTVLAEDAFRLNDLQRQNTQLQQREQALKVDVKKAESPTELARRAHDLGMRPGPMAPKFSDAKDPRSTSKYAGNAASGKHAKKKQHTTTSRHGHTRSTSGNSASNDSAFAGGGR